MTTKPKAKKFRIRRSPSSGEAEARPSATARPVEPPRQQPSAAATPEAAGAARPQDDAASSSAQGQPSGFVTPSQSQPAPANAPQARSGQVSSAAEEAGSTDIEAIKREGLTGRQLRLARRVAHKHDLAATSDYDAVRLLRQRGIDPFQRANMLELVVPQAHKASVPTQPQTSSSGTAEPQTLPQTITREKTCSRARTAQPGRTAQPRNQIHPA